MNFRHLFKPVLLGAMLAHAGAEITLYADFDGAALDVASSGVDGAMVTLAPRVNWLDPDDPNGANDPKGYRKVYFRADGVSGQVPQFRLYRPGFRFDGILAGHRFVYSTDGGKHWEFFDNNSGDNEDFSFSNNAPFASDSVLVSWGIPYPVARARSLVEEIAQASPHITPTLSADADYVLGHGSGGVDDLGRTIPPQELLAFKISDERIAKSQKKTIIVAGGVHSGETNGNLMIDGLVRFAVSADPLAVALRERAEILVYPVVNPDGRYAGYWRSGPENPQKDYNRHWDDPASFTDLTIVRNAMIADSGGDIDMMIDSHCHFRSNATHYLWASNTERVGFLGELYNLRPGIAPVLDGALIPGDPPLSFLDSWAAHPDTLNAELSCTAEAGPNLTASDYDALGRDYAIAIARSFAPADSDGDTIPDHWELSHGSDLDTLGAGTDHDADGRSDFDEWLEDTDPTNPGSFFDLHMRVTEIGDVEFEWQSHAGREYVIEGSDSLRADSWIHLTSPLPGNDATMAATIPLPPSSAGHQFFRMVTRHRQL